MILTLTNAGRLLFEASPALLDVTRVVLGSNFNYTPAATPLGVTGTVLFDQTRTLAKQVMNANTVRYTLFLDKTVGPFDFGEIAVYNGPTLIAVGVNAVPIVKTASVGTDNGNILNLNFFLSIANTNTYGFLESSNSDSNLRLGNVFQADFLVPPYEQEPNILIVNGLTPSDRPTLAYSDFYGLWNFIDRPTLVYNGVVNSASPYAVDVAVPHGVTFGVPSDYILQWTSGRLRGYCRQLNFTAADSFAWDTPTNLLAEEGDTFIIVGPQSASTILPDAVFMFSLAAASGGSHFHSARLTPDQVAVLVNGNLSAIDILSETVDGHQHTLTVTFVRETATFLVTAISNNHAGAEAHIAQTIGDGKGGGGGAAASTALTLRWFYRDKVTFTDRYAGGLDPDGYAPAIPPQVLSLSPDATLSIVTDGGSTFPVINLQSSGMYAVHFSYSGSAPGGTDWNSILSGNTTPYRARFSIVESDSIFSAPLARPDHQASVNMYGPGNSRVTVVGTFIVHVPPDANLPFGIIPYVGITGWRSDSFGTLLNQTINMSITKIGATAQQVTLATAPTNV